MFSSENIYTLEQIDKLGNAIVFLCERMGELSKTKLLKLIYLIEETSVKKYGVPFFNIRFDAWHLGPVSRDLFVEITGETILLDRYIDKVNENGTINVVAKQAFSDDEFSDNELKLMEQIATTFKYTAADELIRLTHREHSPWHQTAAENGLLEAFEKKLATSSNAEIDLSRILAGDDEKLKRYQGYKEFMAESRSLKR
ncbi:Panacea domain-containing protein [Mucilaginibacter rubeus]|uniref:DUF4065 domain-containing protein n=1 Tax=Mucilaginibacter rubeus TaxID=2027860 RepID=A0A5C1I4G9_9SPHI|nr:Panacea domain-containing protein [Mucilaginibacter rubeus]QEM12997.1 DUF4065 domain-containing protein [Mucilaginibacter rubeus]